MCAFRVKGQTLEELPEIHLDAPSIEWLFEMYPEAKDSHAITDLVLKRIPHSKTYEQTGPEPFEGGVDVSCEISIMPFLQEHNADTFVVHSRPSRDLMCRRFEGESDLEPKWDIFCVIDGARGASDVDKLCETRFDKAFLESHEREVLIVHCVPARALVSREYGGEDDWGISRDVDIGGKLVSIVSMDSIPTTTCEVFQAHPTCLHVHADQKNPNKVVELIERQQAKVDITVGPSKLQERLRKIAPLPKAQCYPHLKAIPFLVLPSSSRRHSANWLAAPRSDSL
ncbi:hypothetical protein LTR56_000465 [Elasticomyces elasticus]|nr:hypothetical protein LTR22_014193 [Elasticomyces elasticus]KAK3660707.1 hypothetical protein LTR56_000465 [Elasticomyces elasticus]